MPLISRKIFADLTKRIINWRNFVQNQIHQIAIPEYALFSGFAIITGAVVGLFAVLFHYSIDLLTDFFFDYSLNHLLFIGSGIVIIIPVIGMLIQSIMTSLYPHTAKQRGVYNVIKAVAVRKGYISIKTTIFHFIAPAVCIGSGGTVGPEGPAAQIGGGVASALGGLFGLSSQRRRMFTAAGAGAAIAAVFNTPLGGVFFALEIILLNDFHTPTFSALILASVTASAISRIFLGNQPAFKFNTVAVGSYDQFYLFIILGIVAGLISLAYVKYSVSLESFLKKRILNKYPKWMVMSGVGLIVGLSGFYNSDVFGIGYKAIDQILANQLTWQVVLMLLGFKFILVPLILHSGGFGGLFAPTLFIGACLGYVFAVFMNGYFGLNLDPTVYVLVSMGAVLGGINSIPISAIMIIFEMTKDYSFILPLMLAVIISTTIVQLVLKGSVHEKHLEQEGFKINSGREVNILQSISVNEVMSPHITLFPEQTPLTELISKLIESPHATFFTVDKDGKLSGMITESELRPLISEYENLRGMIVASDIAKKDITSVYPSENLDDVLTKFERKNVEEFPVISESDNKTILGTISRQAIIKAYNRESLKYNLAEGMAKKLKFTDEHGITNVTKGFSIIEKKAPHHFIGKSLAQLKIRNKYGLEVLMIKKAVSPFADESKNEQIVQPDPNYVIQNEDLLVLFGSDEVIENAKNW